MRPIPTIGLFTSGLHNQIDSLKKYGYIIVKRNSKISPSLISRCKLDILSHFHDIERSFSYRFWRYFNHVNSQKRRHSIELPSNIKSVQTLLELSIGSVRNLLQSQLGNDNSPLVEMSAVISKPGSDDQSIHSDISGDVNADLISCFVAMQEINLENGPTCVYSESHTNEFHKYRDNIVPKSSQSTSTYYNNDGSLVEEEQTTTTNDEILPIDINLRQKNEKINTSNPIAAILDVGDILIFNAKIFHFGSKNISAVDRLLMSFSFQKLDMNGDAIPIKGFTYHLSNSMQNKKLKYFPDIE